MRVFDIPKRWNKSSIWYINLPLKEDTMRWFLKASLFVLGIKDMITFENLSIQSGHKDTP